MRDLSSSCGHLIRRIPRSNNGILVRPGKAAMVDERTSLPRLCLDSRVEVTYQIWEHCSNVAESRTVRVLILSVVAGFSFGFTRKDLGLTEDCTGRRAWTADLRIVPVRLRRAQSSKLLCVLICRDRRCRRSSIRIGDARSALLWWICINLNGYLASLVWTYLPFELSD